MLGALKSSASGGVRMLRNVAPPQSTPSSVASLESYGTFAGGDGNGKSCGTLNWSQKRYLRCIPPSSTGSGHNANAKFTINEIENQHRRLAEPGMLCGNNGVPNVTRILVKENHRRSVRGHQSHLMKSLSNQLKKDEKITPDSVAGVYKIVIENGAPTVRVKSSKDDGLVKEWIGIQNELQVIKRDRVEEDRQRLQIAGEQALREMEASLRKGMNLEDLDEAIEGALCSELKDQ